MNAAPGRPCRHLFDVDATKSMLVPARRALRRRARRWHPPAPEPRVSSPPRRFLAPDSGARWSSRGENDGHGVDIGIRPSSAATCAGSMGSVLPLDRTTGLPRRRAIVSEPAHRRCRFYRLGASFRAALKGSGHPFQSGGTAAGCITSAQSSGHRATSRSLRRTRSRMSLYLRLTMAEIGTTHSPVDAIAHDGRTRD